MAVTSIIYNLIFAWRIEKRTKINRLVPFILFSLEFGVFYESLRLLPFLGLLPYLRLYDVLGYYSIILLTLLSFSGAYKLQEILTTQSGNRMKGDEIIRRVYLIVTIVIFIASILTYSESPHIELGYFEFRANPILSVILTACYLPLFIYIFISFIRLQKNIKNKRMKKQIIISSLFLGIFILNRFNAIGFLPASEISFTAITSQLIFLLILHIIGFIFIFKEADFFDSVSSHFCVKSIYILKNTGEMLCGYNFHEEEPEILITTDQLLLIDFIYAISNGLKLALNLDENVDEVEIEDRAIIIKHSEKIIAILLVSEHSQKIHQRVSTFLEAFEKNYQHELENWKANISKFHSEKTQEILFDIFK